MSTDENKALVRLVIEEAVNKGNLDVADQYFASDYVTHIPRSPARPPGPGSFKTAIGIWRTACPDFHMTIEDLIAEGDKVTNRFTSQGTHTGPLFGISPTGNKFTVNGIEIHRVANGKMVESWICDDVPSILVQLGVLPSVGPPKGPPA